jgi:hypothetical protein
MIEAAVKALTLVTTCLGALLGKGPSGFSWMVAWCLGSFLRRLPHLRDEHEPRPPALLPGSTYVPPEEGQVLGKPQRQRVPGASASLRRGSPPRALFTRS